MGAHPPTHECLARSWASCPSPDPAAATPVPGEPGNSSVAGRTLSVRDRPDAPHQLWGREGKKIKGGLKKSWDNEGWGRRNL